MKNKTFIVVFVFLAIFALVPQTTHAYKICGKAFYDCDGNGYGDCQVDGSGSTIIHWWQSCRAVACRSCAAEWSKTSGGSNSGVQSIATQNTTKIETIEPIPLNTRLSIINTDISDLVKLFPSTFTPLSSGSTDNLVDPLSGILYNFGLLNPSTNTAGDLIVPTSINSSIITGIDKLSNMFGLTADNKFGQDDIFALRNFSNDISGAVTTLPTNTKNFVVSWSNDNTSSFNIEKGTFNNIVPNSTFQARYSTRISNIPSTSRTNKSCGDNCFEACGGLGGVDLSCYAACNSSCNGGSKI